MANRQSGRVSKVNSEKGFGFIRGANGDLFFHMSGCVTPFNELAEGDAVEFETVDIGKGPRAERVMRA